MQIVTPPDVEPVTLEEAKLFARIDVDDDDALVTSLITVARDYVETFTRRALITQTLAITLERWPELLIRLPRVPLQKVDSVKYLDTDAVERTFSDYDVDDDAAVIALKYNATWPAETLYPNAPITIQFTVGYGDAAEDVPEALKTVIKLLVAHLYENREPVATSGGVPKTIPLAVDSILWLYRNLEAC